ncbi:hypothetical protein [Streptomyces radicis]|uniref:Uncharacterized protein n=1 Tax=Streptomyces radicis TaxID=1750517 RepID=A0A3A9WDU4_9ACTN|nr:hypothetical protein [Streptomyces radicis]RKN10949.1 hypothetical protein D7319_07375 [Streptomyces radicis]RKN25212.1 hypothetical protein D7318_08230 [Streptomyces radicis]
MDGPHQGQAVTPADNNVEYRLPHPARRGVHCRYLVREQPGSPAPDGEQEEIALHYAGNFLTRAEDDLVLG